MKSELLTKSTLTPQHDFLHSAIVGTSRQQIAGTCGENPGNLFSKRSKKEKELPLRFRAPKGFHAYHDRHGKWRCYHRASKSAIDLKANPLGSDGFYRACEKMLWIVEKVRENKRGAQNLGKAVSAYRRSEAYQELTVGKRREYEKCFLYLRIHFKRQLFLFDAELLAIIQRKAEKHAGRQWGESVVEAIDAALTQAKAAANRPHGHGVTYFFKRQNLVKIGFTRDLPRRRYEIETSCGETVELVHTIEGHRKNEKMMHDRFTEYRTVGEWFRIEGALADFIAEARQS